MTVRRMIPATSRRAANPQPMSLEIFDGAPYADHIVICLGKLEVEPLIDEITEGYRSGRLSAGGRRIVYVAEGCSLAEITFAALKRVRATVLAHETARDRTPSWATALVDANPLHRGLLHLYKALWDDLKLTGVAYSVQETIADAQTWLGDHATRLSRPAGL